MTRLDRYLLSQFMALFGFFALVLVSVYWVNRAVRLFDRLISDGQTAWVVLEFTALTLPYVIRVVLPIAAFAATVYVINRASSESEMVVMQATGASPWRLARPVLAFGVIVALLLSVLSHILVPVSRDRLELRQAQVAQDVSAKLLQPGSFQHPADGITIFIRGLSERGEMSDLYLSDSRSPGQRTTYTAKKAVILPSDSGPKLVMLDGMAQILTYADKRLSVTRFADFTYDMGETVSQAAARNRSVDQITTPELLAMSDDDLTAIGITGQRRVLEIGLRITQALLAPVAAMIGFAALMIGTFSRFGIWKQIVLSILGLILVQALSTTAETYALNRPQDWLVIFAPFLAGFTLCAVELHLASRPRCVRQKGATP
ncbi:LPS export ABC transporter permease LptF [Thioclava sp. SK-1]|nr:LPS export ABC transporter permease LptF [Thioclava sp. SK-1]